MPEPIASLTEDERALVRDGRLGTPGDAYSPGRRVRGEVVRRLLLGLSLPGGGGGAPCPTGGVRIHGTRIPDPIDLSRSWRCDGSPVPALVLEDCLLEGGIDLTGVAIRSLSLARSRLPRLEAPDLECAGSIDLSHLGPPDGGDVCEVVLEGARVGSELRASGAKLCTRPPRPGSERDASGGDLRYALDLTSARIGGGLILQPGFRAFGGIGLALSEIGGGVWASGAYLVAGESAALAASAAHVHGNVILGPDDRPDGEVVPTRLRGSVGFYGARIEGEVWIQGAREPETDAEAPPWSPDDDGAGWRLSLEEARIDGDVHVGDLDAPTLRCVELHLRGARLGGALYLVNLEVSGPDASKPGIFGDGLMVGGDFFLASSLGYAAACRFPTPEDGRRSIVGGPVFLQGARIEGSCWLTGVDLGFVTLDRAFIGGTLQVRDAGMDLLRLEDSRIDGWLWLTSVLGPERGKNPRRVLLGRAELGAGVSVGLVDLERLDLSDTGIDGPLRIVDSRLERGILDRAVIAGAVRFRDVRIPRVDRSTGDWSRLGLSDARIEGELSVHRLAVERAPDPRLETAIEGIDRFRRRRLSCYPGWWLVEARTRVPPGPADPDGPEPEAVAQGESTDREEGTDATEDPEGPPAGVLAFLWRDSDRRSWTEHGAALLLDGSSDPFHALNEAEPPRFGLLRRRTRFKEYLALFTSYIWGGERGAFRVVRRGDLDRFGIEYALEPGRDFEPFRIESLGGSGGEASPAVKCTVLYAKRLFTSVLRISSAGGVEMTDDHEIGRITSGLEETYDTPFRLGETRDDGFPPPGLLPAGLVAGPWWALSGIGWWGRWRTLETGRHRALAARMKAALREAIAPEPRIDLSNTTAGSLDDADGLAWSDRVRIDLDGFRYERATRPDFGRVIAELEAHRDARPERSAWRRALDALRRGLRTVSGGVPAGPVPAGTGVGGYRYRHRERWLGLQYRFGRYNGHEYRPHAYETLATALRNEGATKEARRVLSRKLTIEREVKTPWYLRPFSWLFWAGFDYGLSTTRAGFTVLLFGFVGWLGTWYANRDDVQLLIIDFTPAATVVSEGGETGVEQRPGALEAASVAAEIPCGDDILEPIFALDLMVPILELGQEQRCQVRSTRRAGDDSWLHAPWLWESLGSMYKVLGAIVLSIALLTFSGVLRRHAES